MLIYLNSIIPLGLTIEESDNLNEWKRMGIDSNYSNAQKLRSFITLSSSIIIDLISIS